MEAKLSLWKYNLKSLLIAKNGLKLNAQNLWKNSQRNGQHYTLYEGSFNAVNSWWLRFKGNILSPWVKYRDKGFQLTEIRIIWDRGPKNWSYKGENSSVFEKKFLITNFFNMSFTKRCLWTTWLPGLLCRLIKMWLWMIWLYKITIKSIKRLL